jgi:hypothetical protein
MRVASELERGGLASDRASLLAGPGAPEVAPLPAEAGLADLATRAWTLKRHCVALSDRAQRALQPFDTRTIRLVELGPAGLPDQEEELLHPAADRERSCLAWIFYAQRAAFRAEQAAQLAEIAADQAIALANRELAKTSR